MSITLKQKSCVFRTYQGYESALRAHLLPRFGNVTREKVILSNPIQNIKLPRPNLKLGAFWIQVEIKKFLSAPTSKQDQLFLLYVVAIHTGTRDKIGVKDSTKTKLGRIIPMANSVRELLLYMYKRLSHSDYVFIGAKGEEIFYGHIYRQFRHAQSEAGIKNLIRFHDLRHTFASNYMMNAGNVFDLQKLLGHTKIE